MWGLGLAGASVSGCGVRGWMPAAPGAAALSEVGFVPRFLLLPARCVWMSSRRCWRAPMVCLTPTWVVVTLGRVATFCPGVIGNIIQKNVKWFSFNGKANVEHSSIVKSSNVGHKYRCERQIDGLLPLVARGPPSVSMVVLGVGWVAAVSRGVGALILASLAPSPPWCRGYRAPYSRIPAVHTPSLCCSARQSHLAPAGGAVELVLFQQSGLDAGRACSQQMELLQRNDDQQREKKEEKKRKRTKRALECFQAGDWVLRCTCQKKVNILKKKI